MALFCVQIDYFAMNLARWAHSRCRGRIGDIFDPPRAPLAGSRVGSG